MPGCADSNCGAPLQKDDISSDFRESLSAQTRKEVETMQKGYAQGKDTAVQLLLHHVTTVTLEVDDAMKQGFAKFAKES